MKREKEGEKKRCGEEDGAVSDCCFDGWFCVCVCVWESESESENFEVHFGEGCRRNMQSNIDVSTNLTFALELAQENLWMIFDRRLWVLLKSLSCPHECVVFHQITKQKSDDLLYLRVMFYIGNGDSIEIGFNMIYILHSSFLCLTHIFTVY